MRPIIKSGKRIPAVTGIFFIVGLALLLSACSSTYTPRPVGTSVAAPVLTQPLADSAAPSKKEIIYSFVDTVSENVLTTRKDYIVWWGVTQSFWDVKPTEYQRQWIITVPQEDAVEHWEFNMPYLAAPYVTPMNGAALLRAVLFFCTDRSDLKASCRSYFSAIDRLLGK